MSEATWQAHVLRVARQFGWLVYHTQFSIRSHRGWPDLVLCRPPRILFVELKSDRGRVSPEQRDWLDALRACGLDARVWRPTEHDDEVFETLAEAREGRPA